MLLPISTVNHQLQGLTSVKLLLEPMFENRKPQRLRSQLGQHQEPLQIATATFKQNRLGE